MEPVSRGNHSGMRRGKQEEEFSDTICADDNLSDRLMRLPYWHRSGWPQAN
jgi:hypothetical protein